ncbi:unnamed protein product, partial [Ixodes pacificus]
GCIFWAHVFSQIRCFPEYIFSVSADINAYGGFFYKSEIISVQLSLENNIGDEWRRKLENERIIETGQYHKKGRGGETRVSRRPHRNRRYWAHCRSWRRLGHIDPGARVGAKVGLGGTTARLSREGPPNPHEPGTSAECPPSPFQWRSLDNPAPGQRPPLCPRCHGDHDRRMASHDSRRGSAGRCRPDARRVACGRRGRRRAANSRPPDAEEDASCH